MDSTAIEELGKLERLAWLAADEQFTPRTADAERIYECLRRRAAALNREEGRMSDRAVRRVAGNAES